MVTCIYCNGDLYFSHGTTNSCGVLTLVGKNVDFVLKDKIIDDLGRYVILLCEISGLTVLLLNTYAPNTESAQVTFFMECYLKLIILVILFGWGF